MISTCQEALEPKKHNHKEWISAETLKRIIEDRKMKKAAVNNSHTCAGKAKT